ncbi:MULTISPECIES: AAA family ATPase [unclassified Sporosarcina]|uniref:AAA family ATPase n=1 Tax=unclassified Sporosarcina TaxID=2647733 RepID=UPI00203FE098|nr:MULTISPECIES: AAA family ATPase [unclassified Sporosarcina]GKV65302.1 ABC transporter ATP-binding protein [Sporosarcina sp. NCCP-2331]GLB55426.1 ABC transporter ATP-binding protein [Sporosarcina sp. NCCP-2378]
MLNKQFLKGMRLKRASVPSFDVYPFDLPSIRTLDELDFHPKVTFFVGENGMGKSTLLEGAAVAAGFNPEGGSLNFNFSTYDSHSVLEEYITMIKGVSRPTDGFFLRAETFYNLATTIEELDSAPGPSPRIIDGFGGVSLHEQSHGESFWATFVHRFRGNGVYLLDEPEAALSPMRQLAMLSRIHDLASEGSQFIIATHSPILLAYPEAKIVEFTEAGAQITTLEETSHYQIMKQFFDDKDRMLHHLFNE